LSTFDRDFKELLRLDALRKAGPTVKPAVAPPPEPDDEDDDPDTIFADDVRAIDADIMRASRRYKRGRDNVALTDRHLEFARRLAQGIEPTVAANMPPLRYRLRAIRSLLATPLFVSTYEALRHERSPTIFELIEAARPRAGNTPTAPAPFAAKPGYQIRLLPRGD